MTRKDSGSRLQSFHLHIRSKPGRFRFLVYFLAISIRLLLIAYSTFHNLKFDVKYSDIDYIVYSDSSKYLLAGKSPYLRHTYRYTPLLSLLMVFNELLFHDFGKVLFSLSDIAVGLVLEKLLRRHPKFERVLLASLWLLNPFSIGVSSRGNADTLICLMVVSTLYLVVNRRLLLAALVSVKPPHSLRFGLSVHFKIYPVIYAPAFMFYLYSRNPLSALRDKRSSKLGLVFRFPLVFIANLNLSQLSFALFSFSVFALLTYLSYHFYGFESIFETYLYQYVRKDHRHNFSLYFNLMYYIVDSNKKMNPFVSFLPQLLCVAAFSFVAFFDLPLSLFLTTLSFVVLNKVLTSQYFLWWIALLPLVVPNLGGSWRSARHFLLSIASMLAFKFLWLFWGYRQEFLGYNCFSEMLFSSSFLLLSHMLAAWTLLFRSWHSQAQPAQS